MPWGPALVAKATTGGSLLSSHASQKAMGTMAQDPRAAYNLPAFAQQVNTMTKQQIEIAKQRLDLANEQFDTLKQRVAKLINKPDLTHDDVWSYIATNARTHNLPGSTVAQMVSEVPEDPAQLKPWLQRSLIGIQDKASQLQALTQHVEMVNNGQQQTPVNVNPNAGPVGPTAGAVPIQNQLSPATAPFDTTRIS